MPSAVLPAIAAVASIGGTIMTAVGASQRGQAESQAAQYNANIANQNAQIATQNATYAAQAGQAQEAQAQAKTKAQIGAIQASQAANGLDVNSGSNLDVQSSAAQTGQLNALTIRANTAKQVYGYQTQSWNSEQQAALDNSNASYASTAGDIGVASSLLSGIGSTANIYNQNKNSINSLFSG